MIQRPGFPAALAPPQTLQTRGKTSRCWFPSARPVHRPANREHNLRRRLTPQMSLVARRSPEAHLGGSTSVERSRKGSCGGESAISKRRTLCSAARGHQGLLRPQLPKTIWTLSGSTRGTWMRHLRSERGRHFHQHLHSLVRLQMGSGAALSPAHQKQRAPSLQLQFVDLHSRAGPIHPAVRCQKYHRRLHLSTHLGLPPAVEVVAIRIACTAAGLVGDGRANP